MSADHKNTIINRLTKKIKTCFVAGVVIVAPIGLTLLVIQWIINLMDTVLYKMLPVRFQPDNVFGIHIPGLGLVFSLAVVILAGFFGANYFGRRLLFYVEIMVRRIPLVNPIYTLFKQVADSTLSREGKGFRKPVLLEYPRRGIWSVGFVTGVTRGEVQSLTSQPVINVFVPTTPNPTSGFYLLVPEHEVIPLSMSVDEAFTLVISGGMVTPKINDE